MSNSRDSNIGCGALFLGVIALSVVLWILSIALWALGLAIAIGGVIGAVWLIVKAWAGIGRAKDVEAIELELQGMAHDCAADLGELQLRLLELGTTKGIGTPLEGQLRESTMLIDDLHAKCGNPIRMCRAAPATPQRIEAILHAEQVRAEVRDKMMHG